MSNHTIEWSTLKIFNEDNINNVVEKAGVYRLSSYMEGKYYVFFVGEAENLKKALNKHLTNEENVCIKNHLTQLCAFRYAEISESDVRKGANRFLYNLYKPSCNQSIPEGNDSIEINII